MVGKSPECVDSLFFSIAGRPYARQQPRRYTDEFGQLVRVLSIFSSI